MNTAKGDLEFLFTKLVESHDQITPLEMKEETITFLRKIQESMVYMIESLLASRHYEDGFKTINSPMTEEEVSNIYEEVLIFGTFWCYIANGIGAETKMGNLSTSNRNELSYKDGIQKLSPFTIEISNIDVDYKNMIYKYPN